MPFVLDLLRHGEALATPAGGSDAERRLSPAGREAIVRLASRLAAERWRPDRICSSPLERARETADLMRAALPNAPDIEWLEALAPDREPADVMEALSARAAPGGHLLLVSHQPLVGRLAVLFTGAEPRVPAGTLVRIAFDGAPEPGHGRMVRTVYPSESS